MEEKRLNILFLSSWYPNPSDPFLGIFVKRQAEAIAKVCNVSVIYVCSGEKDEIVESIEDGIYTVRASYKKARNANSLLSQLVQRLFKYRGTWKKAIDFYETKKGKPDLIHANIVIPASLAAMKLSKRWKVPYIISEHWSGYLPQDGRYKGVLMQKLTKLAVRKASAIITVSDALKQAMLNVGLKSNYFIIPNIVDTKIFTVTERPINKANDFTFIHVSSLTENEKNVTGIIRAFNKVHDDFRNAKLLIVGDGDNKAALERLVKFFYIEDAVTFLGSKSKEEVSSLLQQADAFVLFSNFETQGVALLEALCCGIPVIATNSGGPKEYVTADNGILVRPGNEEELIDAMCKMIENRGVYNPIAIRESVVNMVSEENVVRKIMEVYNTVLKK